MSDTVFNAVLFDLDDTLADRTGAFRSWCSWYVDSVLGLTEVEDRRAARHMITALDGEGRGSKDVMFAEIARHYP